MERAYAWPKWSGIGASLGGEVGKVSNSISPLVTRNSPEIASAITTINSRGVKNSSSTRSKNASVRCHIGSLLLEELLLLAECYMAGR